MTSKAGIGDRRLNRLVAVSAARAALDVAYLRCRSTEDLIDEITRQTDPAGYRIVRILAERTLTAHQKSRLASHVRAALNDEFRAHADARLRPKLDRLFVHSAMLMREDDARAIAHAQLQHRLAARRHGAVRVLHKLGVTEADRTPALTAIRQRREAHAVSVLALLPGGLNEFDCCGLLQICEAQSNAPFDDDTYLGAVAIEGLARAGVLDHLHASIAHPLHYIRAVGRLRDAGLAEHALRSVDVGGTEVLPMALSVAGRLGDLETVKRLETILDGIGELATHSSSS